MTTVFCIFRHDTDGYTFNCDTLVGVSLSQSDAETLLLTHIAELERLKKIRDAHEERLALFRGTGTLWAEFVAESQQFSAQYGNVTFYEPDIDKYSIREIEIGKIIEI